jgi:protein subunit release factor B
VRRQKLFTVSIKNLEVQTFRAGGKGGQHQNKTESGVRLIHRPSGAVGESREMKSQFQNKKRAFVRLVKTKAFDLWLKRKSAELCAGESIEDRVERQMSLENLKIEKRGETGKWEPFDGEAA